MILQSLVHLYDELSRQGKVAKEGWGIAKVSHRLVINTSGQLIGIISARRKVLRGKKEKEIPTEMIVPLPVIRAVGIKANFLCDSSSYMLGVMIRESRKEPGNVLKRLKNFITISWITAHPWKPKRSLRFLTPGM